MRDAPVGIKRKHTSRDAVENSFYVPAALLKGSIRGAQIATGGFNLAAASLELFRHAIERAYQVSNLVSRADFNAIVQASSGNFLHGFSQCRHRTRHQLREKQCE